MIHWWQILLLTLYSAYQICDELTIVSSAGSPVFAGLISGLIMGDMKTGLIIGGGCGAHEVDGGLGIACGESRVAKIGEGGVGRADGPVQRIQVEGPMQGEGVRAGIDVGQDVLCVDGQERVPVQTGGQVTPYNEIGVDHDAGRAKRAQRVQFAGGPKADGIDFRVYSVQHRMDTAIPQEIQAKGGIVVLGRAVAQHGDRAVFPPPVQRGQRRGKQLKRRDGIGHGGAVAGEE